MPVDMQAAQAVSTAASRSGCTAVGVGGSAAAAADPTSPMSLMQRSAQKLPAAVIQFPKFSFRDIRSTLDAYLTRGKTEDYEDVFLVLQLGAEVDKERDNDTFYYTYRASEALLTAARRCHLHIVALLLENGLDVGRTKKDMLSAAESGLSEEVKQLVVKCVTDEWDRDRALVSAAAFGHTQMVKWLLSLPQRCFRKHVFQRDWGCWRTQWTISLAVERGHTGIVELLLDRGSVAFGREAREKALEDAARRGFTGIVAVFLDKGVPMWDKGGALSNAAAEGHISIVALLLEDGVPESVKASALETAASHGHSEVVDLLLDSIEKKVALKVARRQQEGMIASQGDAKERDYTANVVLLPEDGERKPEEKEALKVAAELGHGEIVSLLLKNGVGWWAKGWALRAAAERGHREVVTLILDNHGVRTKGKTRASEAAVASGHTHTVVLLLDKDVRLGSFPLEKALLYSARKGFTEIVALLLEKGVRSLSKQRAIAAAAGEGNIEVVALFLNDGVGETAKAWALKAAAANGKERIFAILLDSGVRESDKEMALVVAAKKGEREVLDLLLGKGVGQRWRGRALKVAAEYRRTEIVRVLLAGGIGKRPKRRALALSRRRDVEVFKLILEHVQVCRRSGLMIALR
uniref:Uncharacterized protein n=1 Tax=Chromera velia CCMP2878 TaxID=1169474 RepID=A0A0G4GA54_9ALVE|eukprot:Cvel_20953.t1-p1 / transcript=Cvel_20953.t1 / gene=Cvel_20953 / organism=Chromera_velia_CCMP2878 / gene_product=Putative ankyrin repeat protein R863, putative / transcript_product=Putative ankyrin repeat protein R863, putative / location=Cvel_scaffold1925:22995-32403(+) / protein_length=636 / sequence_SO=supercontig / SO=protein_coding / is_pseudo=false